jgi:hypothetical protein
MGLIYEHWRPDTNECFYVGASRDAMDERPYYYGHHNSDYDAVVEYLSTIGMTPFTKIVWDNLGYECTGAFERIRIAYQRVRLGDKLTNKAPGGFLYTHVWTDAEKEALSIKMTEVCNTAEHRFMKSVVGEIAQNRPNVKATRAATNAKPEVKAQRKASQSKPETVASKSAANTAAHARPDVKDRHREGCRRGQNTPEALLKRQAGMEDANEKRSATLALTNKLPEVQQRRSKAATEVQSRPEIKLKKSLKLRGEGNGSCKLNEKQVIEILCSKESRKILAAKYSVSTYTIWAIHTGRSWKYLPREK